MIVSRIHFNFEFSLKHKFLKLNNFGEIKVTKRVWSDEKCDIHKVSFEKGKFEM